MCDQPLAWRSRPMVGGYRLARPFAVSTWVTAVCAIGAATALLPAQPLAQQAVERPQSLLELIDPKVFRVCADPHNMPFSTDKGEGFENKLAEMFADKLGKGLAYAWYPQATGFVRNTLAAHKCDVMMGAPQGDDLVQVTNPYYRTAYALVFKRGSGLDGVDTLEDARLKGKRIGIVAGTPPGTNMPSGSTPTCTSPSGTRFSMSMTVTVLASSLATYRILPVGSCVNSSGSGPDGRFATISCVAVSII